MTNRKLLDRWFIPSARRGKPPAVRIGNDLTFYIHYADYYAAVGDAVRTVGEGSIVLLAGWGIDLQTKVGSASAQQAIGELLKQVGAKHAKVRVMLSGHLRNPNKPAVDWLGKQPGCAAILDDRLRLAGCFHQKAVIISNSDDVTAFVGGMDISADRLADPQSKRAPWHDVQVKIRGPSAADGYATLAARWESHHANRGDRLPRVRVPDGVPKSSGRAVQVVRTYGNPRSGIPLTAFRLESPVTPLVLAYRKLASANEFELENPVTSLVLAYRKLASANDFEFAPTGESAIHDLMVRAIRATRETIYVEDQYFVASSAIGGNEELLQALADTIARPTFKHMLVLTAGAGTVQVDLHQTNRRRRELVRRIAGRFPKKISVWAYKGGQDRCSWLHSKMWLFDDTMAVIGSANFNRRGLSHDGELAVGVVDLESPTRGWVHELRKQLWLKHLTSDTRPVTPEQVADFQTGRTLWVDTPDTLLSRVNTEAGDLDHPDKLILCDDPMPPPGLGRLYRHCACAPFPFGVSVRSYDAQWNQVLDPDGT